MDQLSQNAEGPGARLVIGKGHGVADTETHAEVGGADELERASGSGNGNGFTLYHKVMEWLWSGNVQKKMVKKR